MRQQWHTTIGFILAILCTSYAFGEDSVRLRQVAGDWLEQSRASADPRGLVIKFKERVQPALHFEGKTARDAIDELNQLGFQCLLVGEQEDPFMPPKRFSPFVLCQLLVSLDNRIYGAVSVGVHMKGWKGDGIPLSIRFDQFATAEVSSVLSSYFPYRDNRDAPDAKEESRSLNRNVPLAAPGQSVAEVVKYAMLNEIGCSSTSVGAESHTSLNCFARNVTPRCLLALIGFDIADVRGAPAPPSLWSTEGLVKAQRTPWICVSSFAPAPQVR